MDHDEDLSLMNDAAVHALRNSPSSRSSCSTSMARRRRLVVLLTLFVFFVMLVKLGSRSLKRSSWNSEADREIDEQDREKVMSNLRDEERDEDAFPIDFPAEDDEYGNEIGGEVAENSTNVEWTPADAAENESHEVKDDLSLENEEDLSEQIDDEDNEQVEPHTKQTDVKKHRPNKEKEQVGGDIFGATGDDSDENGDEDGLNCTKEEMDKLPAGSHERLLREADCGSGYIYDDGTRNRNMEPVRVILYGMTIRDSLTLSGCPVGSGRCHYHPKCTFALSSSLHSSVLNNADVVVGTPFDALDFKTVREKTKKRVRRVLYWREPYWNFIPQGVQNSWFDIEMGVHFTAGIINPNYLRRPRTLLQKSLFEFLPFEKRSHFALSIISNCNANSERQTYIDHLSDYLGQGRVHQYGACGNRKLPPAPIQNAASVIAKYKFYLSFENTIQSGYVSEKFFTVLNMQLLPVYLGAHNVPNITKVPSFIKVHDFKSPKDLAQYLLYLDSHPEEYSKYHQWRDDPSLFTEEYLETIKRKFPSQQELKVYGKQRGAVRMAGCCRLCNLAFLDEQIARRKHKDLIGRPLSEHIINREFFAGKLYKRPGPDARLAGPPGRTHGDTDDDD